ncbi:MAG: hypothetical protein RMY34_12275 [Aulosira sp. DedQUE10]|nr:hypothetical protein [Aulosira sp. DedQUE10]
MASSFAATVSAILKALRTVESEGTGRLRNGIDAKRSPKSP